MSEEAPQESQAGRGFYWAILSYTSVPALVREQSLSLNVFLSPASPNNPKKCN
jgi:hypothetical protein